VATKKPRRRKAKPRTSARKHKSLSETNNLLVRLYNEMVNIRMKVEDILRRLDRPVEVPPSITTEEVDAQIGT